MAGGSGYVLSKGALEMFAAEVKARKVCLDEGFKWGGEDIRMGQCLTKLNVSVGDSRDSGGRARFMIWNPREHIIPRERDLFNCPCSSSLPTLGTDQTSSIES